MSSLDDDSDYLEHTEDTSNRDGSHHDLASEAPASARGKAITQRSRPKRASELERNARADRRRILIDRYVSLFNEAVRDLGDGTVYDSSSILYDRILQNGAVRWTRRERNAFYNGLAKFGKGETTKIARLIETKSEMEVRALIQVLDRNLRYRTTRHREPGFHAFKDIPAAVEVSTVCCHAMEKSAGALIFEEESKERLVGSRNYGDLYAIDGRLAAWVEEKLRPELQASESRPALDGIGYDDGVTDFEEPGSQNGAKDGDTPDVVEDSVIFTVGRLFNLSNWIRLSENIFMNPGGTRKEDNWRSLSAEIRSPSLTCESFSEFYALAISLTRRIIQSTIFFALSRTRALERAGLNVSAETFVRKEDILTAIDILRLPRDSHEFWAKSARHCSLDVVHDIHRKGSHKIRLSYNQVEGILLPRENRNRFFDYERILSALQKHSDMGAVVVDARLGKHLEDAGLTDGEVLSDDEYTSLQQESDAEQQQVAGAVSGEEEEEGERVEKEEGEEEEEEEEGEEEEGEGWNENNPEFESPSDYEDYIADKADNEAAAREDIRLRKQLGLPSPTDDIPIPKSEEDVSSTLGPYEHPLNYRRSMDELADWRDRLVYYSEWEQYGPEIGNVIEMTGRSQKRRRLR
ncbi:hypothetical protein KEM54_006749 [Ascosphaera aggregata]|nr:hypothetical protein KEM54_006749 [Ascosphaera aggregata]